VIEKEKKTKLNNYTIQHNETKSIDRISYIQLKPYMSTNVNNLILLRCEKLAENMGGGGQRSDDPKMST